MTSLGIASLFSFFSEETKSIRKGENHYKSGHVESFVYQQGVLRGEVHASMKKKVYKVTVSSVLYFILCETKHAGLIITCFRSELLSLLILFDSFLPVTTI